MGEWITPLVSGILTILAGAVAGAFAVHNRRRGNREQREPDVTEAWAEADKARAEKFAWMDWGYDQRGGFKGYARRMQADHGEQAALNDAERAILETPPPVEK